jgi:hypothetical protein
MKYWVNTMCGNPYYFERNEQPNEVCIEVPTPRPSREHYWYNGEWILAGFMDKDGNYHLGDMSIGDRVIPLRPSHLHTWDGQKWVFTDEKALEEIRQKRDVLLKASDYIVAEDIPLDPEVKAQWISYRQALRDFPQTCDPVNPIWPKQPAYIKA